MKTILSLKKLFPLLAMLVLMVSCENEVWNEHYTTEVTEKSELTIYEYIKSKPELSKFAKALEISGFDKVLSEDITYTVWAPDNDALAGLDLTDSLMVDLVVRNHVTRFSHPTSRIDEKSLLMMNGKILDFKRQPGNVFTLHGKELRQPNIAVRNGMIHLLKGYVPYILNQWEYIFDAEGIDSLRNYIISLTSIEFDYDASYQDGVLVDSLFKLSNAVLTSLADLNKEDSIYTTLLPSDKAWSDRLAMVLPYYKTLEVDGGQEAQLMNARWSLVRDLFFRGRLKQPVVSDSIQSTVGTQFTNASQLFPATPPVELSNGYSYIVDAYQQKPGESFLKPIRIEAENASYGRSVKDYEISLFSSLGTGFDISGRYYINARALSTNSTARMSINFPIPNTLASKYNIYCVFVPMSISDSTNARKYKVRFSINYNYNDAAKNDSVWVGNNGYVKPHTQAKLFETESKKVTKVLVAQNYEFPWANLYGINRPGSSLATDKIRVGLRVENAAGTTVMDRLNYSRDLRIDYIVLEPVQ